MPKDYSGAVSSTQIGAVAESLVATRLMVASAGRLSPYRPLADDAGIDILIHDKHTGCAVPLQIKSRTVTLKRHPSTVHFQVRCATFHSSRTALLLAVLLDPATMTERRAWLIPMNRLESVCRRGKSNLIMRPSIQMDSKDRYTQFRCADLSQVADRIIAQIDK